MSSTAKENKEHDAPTRPSPALNPPRRTISRDLAYFTPPNAPQPGSVPLCLHHACPMPSIPLPLMIPSSHPKIPCDARPCVDATVEMSGRGTVEVYLQIPETGSPPPPLPRRRALGAHRLEELPRLAQHPGAIAGGLEHVRVEGRQLAAVRDADVAAAVLAQARVQRALGGRVQGCGRGEWGGVGWGGSRLAASVGAAVQHARRNGSAPAATGPLKEKNKEKTKKNKRNSPEVASSRKAASGL